MIYAESDRNYTHFHLVNGKTKTIVISLNKVMTEIECCKWQWCIWGIYHGCLVTGKMVTQFSCMQVVVTMVPWGLEMSLKGVIGLLLYLKKMNPKHIDAVFLMV